TALAVLALTVTTAGQDAAPNKAKLTPNKPNEPKASAFSLEKGAGFLDNASLAWTQGRKCGTCHTNVPHLMARAVLRGQPSAEEKEVRKFFEDRAANWDRGRKGDEPRWDTEVVVTAVTLAFHDAHTTGKLHPTTRKALDRMWTVQQKDG